MIRLQVQKQLNAAMGAMQLKLDIDLPTGQLYALYGKSGAGKTSVLRMLAGLLSADQGSIRFNQETWFSTAEKINLKPQKRKVGLVFQDYALFPNMSVEQNLRFALGKQQSPEIIEELIGIMELEGLRSHRPAKLSGGQQQRLALARALVQKPKLLLLDEPLSALDNDMRQKLQYYIREVHEKYQITTILVSHNQEEVQTMADQVIVLDAGEIIQQGTPAKVFKTADQIRLPGFIQNIKSMGDLWEITIEIPGQPLVVLKLPPSDKWQIGGSITIDATPP